MPTGMDFVTVENTHEMAGNWERRAAESATSSINCSASDADASHDETLSSLPDICPNFPRFYRIFSHASEIASPEPG